MFQRYGKKSGQGLASTPQELTRIVPVEQLLGDERRRVTLQNIRRQVSLASARYDSLCFSLLHTFSGYCQQFPETDNSYYAYPGGMLDRALNRTEAALELFRTVIISGEDTLLSEDQMLWQYALFSAALLKGISKLKLHLKVNLFDAAGQPLKLWNPLLESLSAVGSQYSYAWEKGAEPELSHRLNILMARQLMPASGFAWIASHPQVLAVWLALLSDDTRSAGTLGALLVRADALSLRRALMGLIADGRGRGTRAARMSTFVDVPEGGRLSREQETGVVFLQWLAEVMANGQLQLNKPPLMMVLAGMMLLPEAFQLFVRQHPEYKNWLAVQKGLLSLGIHRVAVDGGFESRYEQANTQQIHTGIVLDDYALALPESVLVHNLYTGSESRMSALEVINLTESGAQALLVQQSMQKSQLLQQLNPQGEWKTQEMPAGFLQKPGSVRGG